MYGKWLGFIAVDQVSKLLGGGEPGINCSAFALEAVVVGKAVEFDADIAGLGVLIGFLCTAVLGFVVLIVAYATYSIPPRLLNEVDAVLASALRKIFAVLRDRLKLSKLLRRRTVGTDKREDRIKTFTSFMLSVSDQILVAQLAILIAAFVGLREITVYSVNIIVALGCLASTVHLATFPLLVERLTKHRVAKALRAILMVMGAGMLIFFLIIQLSSTWYESVYFLCGFRDLHIEVTLDFFVSLAVPGGILYATYEVIKLLYGQPAESVAREEDGRPRDGPMVDGNDDRDTRSLRNERSADGSASLSREHDTHHVRQDAATGARVPTQPRLERSDTHQTREAGQNMVNGSDDAIEMQPNPTVFRDQRQAVDTVTSRNSAGGRREPSNGGLKTNDLNTRISIREFYRRWRQADRSHLSRQWLRIRSREILARGISPEGLRWSLLTLMLAESWSFHECQGSFMWRMLWLWSGNVYGIAAVFTAHSDTASMSGSPYKMGFGQIVPLALLLLPLFAASQSLADYWEDIRNYVEPPQRDDVSGAIRRTATGRSDEGHHDSLVEWAEGSRPTCSREIRGAIALYTVFMVLFTTAVGFCFAVDFVPADVTKGFFFVMMAIELRRLYGSCSLFVFTYRKNRNFETERQREGMPGDQAQRMTMAHGTEDTVQEPEDTV